MTDLDLDAIEARLKKVPEGPYFTSLDDAPDCPDHANSGLAMVDTGRDNWPIARLCEWPAAHFIANAITDIPALIAEVRRLHSHGEAKYQAGLEDAIRIVIQPFGGAHTEEARARTRLVNELASQIRALKNEPKRTRRLK